MKAILVTGGGSGIGQFGGTALAREGWRVGLADVNACSLVEPAAMLPPERVSTHQMDVRDASEWEHVLADFTALTGGRLDVLFNNAEVAAGGPFGAIDLDALDRVIDVNFRGVAYGARLGYPYLKGTPGSCLLNTAYHLRDLRCRRGCRPIRRRSSPSAA
ncbi:SDR family NAD(P)-dependent oxidoreductase [Sphingomonas sp. MMS24-JH45]